MKIAQIGVMVALAWSGGNARAQVSIIDKYDVRVFHDLLKDVDQSKNANALKFGFFGAHRDKSEDVVQGWAALNEALKAQDVGSKTWFVLQNIRGFAALRCSSLHKEDSFAAYGAIFDRTDVAITSRQEYLISKSLQDFLAAQRLEDNGVEVTNSAPFSGTLSKAWESYLKLRRANLTSPPLRALWVESVDASGVPSDLMKTVVDQVDAGTLPTSTEVLSVAAYLLSFNNQQLKQSLALFTSAKAQLLTTEPQNDAELIWVYDQMIALERRNGNNNGVRLLIREKIKILNVGRKDLLWLPEAFKPQFVHDLVTSAVATSTPESEILDLSVELYKLGYDEHSGAIVDRKALDEAIRLLMGYQNLKYGDSTLTVTRIKLALELSRVYEVKASLHLALEALPVEAKSSDPQEQYLLGLVSQTRQRLTSKLSSVSIKKARTVLQKSASPSGP